MPVHVAAAIRSPFGRVDGALAGWHPVALAAEVMNAAAGERSIDRVFVGCAEPVGAQGANMARAAILTAGWPDHIPGIVVDAAETSGTAALHAAVAAIESGAISTAMVVGVCSASVVQPGAAALGRTYGRPWGDGPAGRVEAEGGLLPAPSAADRAAKQAGISREDQDAWAIASLERRSRATPAAIVTIGAVPGAAVAVQRGTEIAADDLRERPEDPSAMPPSFEADGSVTGFSFAPPADGVAVLVLTTDTVGAEIVGVGHRAGHPLDPTGGIVGAVEAAGITEYSSVARWEIGEPTAASTLLAIERLGVDPARVNLTGGTLGVGDAGAAEELRLVTDGISAAEPGEFVVAAAYGPGGAAVTFLRCP